MGMYKVETCIFTGLPAEDVPSSLDGIEYYVTVGRKRFMMRLPYYATQWEEKEPFFNDNKYLFHALLLNNKWFDQSLNFVTIESLKQLISQREFPKTPQQKTEALFYQLYKLQKEDGQAVKIFDILFKQGAWRIFFFKSVAETMFYFQHLENQGLIKMVLSKGGDVDLVSSYNITYFGLEHAIKLEGEGDKSKKCFIAMSFDPSTKEAREAIREALHKTGYEAVIIDEQIIDSERTINDEIIASLKRCKFCIADFSLHSKGVYFESGFALGQGKKVIYTCSKSEFANAHFDIKPLQHIVYETTEQLTKDLINKIEAYIN